MNTSNKRPVRQLLGTLALGLAAASLAPSALAQPMGPQGGRHGGHDMNGPGMGGPGMGGHGMGGHGMRGHGMGGRGMEGPGMLGGRALDLVNATADQRAQIKTIMEAARTDLKTNHDSARSLQQQLHAAFAAATVDPRAVENLRAQISALRDTASKRMTQAMLDASKVLTAEQRKTLADTMAKRQAMMQRHAAERAALDKPASK